MSNPCVIPTMVQDTLGDGRWMSQHKRNLAEGLEREPEVVLIGDSIIHCLMLRSIWHDLFEPLHCLNFGIEFDETQHVLWRINDGILDHVKPKVVVVHVGTYNTSNTPDQISAGILEIANAIRSKLPETNIVICSILPRGQHDNPLRKLYAETNKEICSKVANFPKLEYIDISKELVQPDGTISHHDMLDYLRPTNAGYHKCFEPVHELLIQLLSEHEVERDLTPSE
ncbi:unnamed protein product [Bemisia tabaci]|uniref:SGNH hydrolase-type esterase domain-containing protein n=1 Tax=Bemisia tabaci TaxID=7038 RepID=A0A9P0AGD4_BEMTA|nr:PREDICTED: platelet-activating factor acetylhydrolase IB subunit beta homolog isoform X1 [Bemisia tabaci]CAH0392547.1 unnamed protein product [Bemisia tabaci]